MKIQDNIEKLHKRDELKLSNKETIELCLDVIENCPNIIEKQRAAVIVASIVDPESVAQLQSFIKNHKLSVPIMQILGNAVMRMAGF